MKSIWEQVTIYLEIEVFNDLVAERKPAQITDVEVNDECIFASNSDGKRNFWNEELIWFRFTLFLNHCHLLKELKESRN